MHARPILSREPSVDWHASPPLRPVLQQCESLQEMVDAALRARVDAHARQAAMRQVSAKLSDIVEALHWEIRHRDLVDHQLAAAVEQQEASQKASLHDALTGLPNRALFQDRLDHSLGQARRHAWNLALMFIDLDSFKRINDDHGHSAGDAVLRIVAGRLRDNTRVDDTISRHGGDEFTYLALDVSDTTSVARVAHKLIDAIGKPCNVILPTEPHSACRSAPALESHCSRAMVVTRKR